MQQTAMIITAAGGPEVLQVAHMPLPRPGQHQVLIKVTAAGVNRHDCNQRAAGVHHDGNPIPGLEASGVVVQLGDDVTDVAVGDQVMALLQGGGYAQFALADTALVMKIPQSLNMDEAACIPEALFTAWWNFFGLMHLKRGEFALIHGGTSGVGHLALQALSALGYRVLATAGSDEKVKAATGFGAYAAFSYKDADLAAKVRDATGGAGISALLDMSAGAHIAADLEMMAPDGRIAHLSAGGGGMLQVPLKPLMAKRISITGSLLRPLALSCKAEIAELIRRDVLPLFDGRMRPTIASRFPLEDAAAAHREMEKGSHIGKILLHVSTS
ncbi:NAD(P)H-quinone oxidoreductase [Hoeflea alexandrii]|uniref:NAD(P)H-quinone oxidoreductase n=1 Tax=Hoeflea alexandrii TaxID=288436 RepID=UPI0022B01C9F|nr:NAD(P)H-quinone oxidoreductase [Hoeflea alexandrii]MCZ4291721.1 NAD(P)H-quinone oxidoreductase [Hoeflea alexandrii]